MANCNSYALMTVKRVDFRILLFESEINEVLSFFLAEPGLVRL